MKGLLGVYLREYREADWRAYAACFAADWAACPPPVRDALLAFAGGDEVFAMGLYGGVGPGSALAWLDAEIPALDGRTPRAVMAMARGREALSACIMRMPV